MKYTILVKPGSKKGPLVEVTDSDELLVYVKERAVDGKANEAVVALLAKYFGVAKSLVVILNGHSGRKKIVKIG